MPDAKEDLLRPRLLEVLAVLPVSMLLGILTGVITNAVNGWLSPAYFTKQFPEWSGASNYLIWLLCLGQGALEGALNGLGIGFVLMIGVAIISRIRCPLRQVIPIQLKIMLIALISSCAFGLNGILLALFAPQFFDLFFELPSGLSQSLKFAWVSGSLIGILVGGIIGTVLGLITFNAQWKIAIKPMRQ